MLTCATLLWVALLGCSSPEAATPVESRGSPSWEVIQPAVEEPERWGAARCNDGSPATVLLHRGSSKDWVIRVSGGYYCDEKELLCRERAKRFTGPLTMAGKVAKQGQKWEGPHPGLFSLDARNPLAAANQVTLQYCSSDVWLGESTERQPILGDAEGYYFSGTHILRADLEALRAHGFDPTDPEVRVVLVGQSSGAVGLAHNLDTVKALMPEAVAQGRVFAVFDGGWIPQVPMNDTFRLNRWGSWLPACEADNPEDPGVCLFGDRWYPYWKQSGIELLVVQSGMDLTQLKALKIDSAVARAAQRETTKASLQAVPRVVSGGWSYHVIAFDPRVENTVFGRMLLEEVGRMLKREEPKQVFHRYEEAP